MKRNILMGLFIVAVIGIVSMINTTPLRAWLSVDTRVALDNMADLTTPTSTQKYPVGKEIQIYDSTKKAIKTYVYVKAKGSVATAYRPYAIIGSSEAGSEYYTSIATIPAQVTSTAQAYVAIGIPQNTITANYWGFVQTGGDCTAYIVTGSTVGTLGMIKSGASNAVGITGLGATITQGLSDRFVVGISKKSKGATGSSATTTYFLFNRRVAVYPG